MFLAENLKSATKCEYRIWLVKHKWAKPKPILQTEREQEYKEKILIFLLCLFYSWIDANASSQKVAAKVLKYRRNVTLEPMNAYERHVIHTALQEVPGVTTYSTGIDPNRRVIVAYDRDKR